MAAMGTVGINNLCFQGINRKETKVKGVWCTDSACSSSAHALWVATP